jgi:O-antigen/teichoic acid export membrane protein
MSFMRRDEMKTSASDASIFRHYFRAFVAGGILSATRLVTGFIRIKYIALVLGTTGVGYLSQATQLQLLGTAIGSLSMAVGIITRVGQVGSLTSDAARRVLATALTSQSAASGLLLALAIGFLHPISRAIFGDALGADSAITTAEVLAVIASVPITVVASGYLEAVFFAAARYDLYVRASVVATILGFAATVAIIAVWRLPGALWSFPVAAMLLLGAFVFYVRRVQPLSALFQAGFSAREANALFRFSIAVLVSGALVPAARLWIQRTIIQSQGIAANGLLQVPFAVNAYYAPFLTNALWGRMHPAVARMGAGPEARRELVASVRLTTVMATAAIVSILFLKDLLVPLAYSREFAAASRLLPAQLFGDLFYFVAFPFTVYALGVARLRVYLAAWGGYSLAAVAASLALIPRFGLLGVPLGYAVASAMGVVAAGVWLFSRWDRTARSMALTVGASVAVVSTQCLLAWTGAYYPLQGVIAAGADAAALWAMWSGWSGRAATDQTE